MTAERNDPIILRPGEGRAYDMGGMRAVFKADEAETGGAYAVSEWRLEPHTEGPGPHSHDANDDIFYVLEGTVSFLVGEDWIEASAGTFVRAAPGVTHDFANRTDRPAGLLNLYVPGGFERDMPAIVDWFARNDG